ncbi:MAG: response regulator [Deltaproteobacteria bacterium]|nr:response regulator [Deltaproteobacteria bacterium]
MPKKILLADDSMTIQKVISITLSSEDYDLTIVGDGNSAVAKAKAVKPDLILVDVAMPGKNGYEVCDIVKKDPELAKTPVMLLAGTFEPLNKEEAARVKADDNIIKPFESTSFVEKVKALLARAEAAAAPKKVEEVELPEAKPELTGNVWEAGDFLGTPEDEAKADANIEAAAEAELDFFGGDLFGEAAKEAEEETAAPPDQAFMDLEIGGQESAPPQKAAAPPPKPAAPPPPPPPAPPKPPVVERKAAPPPAPPAPAPPEIDFAAFKAEPFSAPQEEEAPSYWTGEAQEAPAPAPPSPAAPEARREPARPVQAEPPPAPPRPPVAQRPASPELLKLYQRKPAKEAAPPPPAKPVERVVEKAVAAVEERAKEAASASPAIAAAAAVSREEMQEMVKRAVREVVEEIAWEVVPELAEEIVMTEMGKLRESFLKVKEKRA